MIYLQPGVQYEEMSTRDVYGKEIGTIMKINKIEEGNKLTVAIEGRLDTTTAPELENEFKASLENVEDLLLDFEKLDYISSAGLRVLLSAQKQMNKVGKMTITNVSPEIMEIFEVTGFSDILTFA